MIFMTDRPQYRAILLAAILLTTLACSLPASRSSTLEDTVETDSPAPSDTAAACQSQPTTEDHYRAMRLGLESDVDAHADGLHYWLTLNISDNPVRVEASQRVHYVNTTGTTLDDIVFRVPLNALAEHRILEVADVTVNGAPASYEWLVDDSALRVPLAGGLAPGDAVEIGMNFSFALQPEFEVSYGRLADVNGVIVLSAFFPMLSVYEADGWWLEWPEPMGDPAYSEVALFDVALTAPADLQVASTGVVLASQTAEGGTACYQIVTGPVRDFSLALSPDFELTSDTRDGVTVNLWSAPGGERDDAYALDVAFASLAVYGEQFGVYPFAEFDVVSAPISAAGIEYPGLIYIADSLWDENETFFEAVIAHEVGHQWWYSMVGNDQVGQPWLDEGLTEYSVEVYYRERYGSRAGAEVRSYYQEELDAYLAGDGRRLPIGLPVSAYNDYQYRVFVYSAGALTYSYLSDDYGVDGVRDLLRAYYDRYRYGLAYTGDMGDLVEEFFGQDARAFFDEWVSGL